MSIRVSIVDDHPLAIEGLCNMLSSAPSIKVSNTYTTGNELLQGLQKDQPDVLLLDMLLPDIKGNELAKQITTTYPNIQILVITSLDAPVRVKSMIQQGCKGYILKNTDKKSLIHAIEEVAKGIEYIEPILKEKMLNNLLHYRKAQDENSPNLTHREKEILKLVVSEYSNQQIADQLHLSLRTVETHRFNLQKKLNVTNNIALVKIAIQMGLMES